MATIERQTGAEEVEWDLSDLYAGPDDPRLEEDLGETRDAAARFRERYYGKVAELDAAGLAGALAERERIESVVVRARTYAHLRFTTNTADPPRGALLQRIGEHAAALESELLFFRLEWAAVEDARADELLEDEALAHYAHFLRSARRYRPHLLSEPEERILAEKSVSGPSAFARLYSELLSALRIPIGGDEISIEGALARLQDADRDVRREAAEGITAGLRPGLRTRAFVFNALLLDKSIDDRLRKYPHWLASRNLANETPDETVEALIDAAVSRYDIPQRYYRLKAKLIGVDRLAHYDRFAPIADETSFTTWDDAREIVVEAYTRFSPEAGRIVGDFFERSWIDGPVRPDKTNGAYCATTVPGVHPYVFMNYTGDRRSILTLAHELGHALHGVLAQPQGLFNASTPLTLAETASVFGEALTFEALLEAESDPRRRLDLLASNLEDAIATVFRQIAMNRFEDAVHTARRGEGELSSDRIAEAWLATQADLLGDSVDRTGYDVWWSYVPHFVSVPGYVYAYAYGYLFSLAIYRRYQQEGESMIEPYFDLLRAGGSDAPERLAAIVGLDLSSRAIWETGLDAIGTALDEAEALAAEVGLG